MVRVTHGAGGVYREYVPETEAHTNATEETEAHPNATEETEAHPNAAVGEEQAGQAEADSPKGVQESNSVPHTPEQRGGKGQRPFRTRDPFSPFSSVADDEPMTPVRQG